jgi:predicted negative regulator of RcsB-dependent stress response
MKAEKRITKRQMKGDRLVSTTFKATEYIQKNQTPFVLGTAAIVVVFLLIVFIRWNADRKRNDAAGILTRAEITAAMGDMNQYFAELQNLSDNYGGTTAGKLATLRLANNSFDSEDYTRAEDYFKRIQERYADDKILSAGAAAGLGACYEMRENSIQAADQYDLASRLSEGEYWAASYLYKAGLNYSRAGDKTRAAAAFKLIEEKYQNSSELSAARRALAELNN